MAATIYNSLTGVILLTEAQKNAITTADAAIGLFIYQTDAVTGFYQLLSSGWSLVYATTIFTPSYGYFLSTVSQSATTINTAKAMTYNVTTINQNVSVVSNSQMKVTEAGVYDLEFNAQVRSTAGGINDISIWVRKNGIDLPNSCSDITINNNQEQIVAWDFMINMAANDYVEIYWSTPSLSVTLNAFPTRTAPVRPAAPCVVANLTRIA